MSNRREQYGSKTPNPAVRYYEWASDEKSFKYYDKEKKENVLAFPLSVAYLTERASVKGWHNATESGIYSNEVKNLKTEKINVYSSKADVKGNTLLFTGIYSEGKGQIDTVGGHFNKAVYAYEFGVGIVKIDLKGTAAFSFSTFNKESKKAIFDSIIISDSFKEEKNGKVKYTIPEFKLGEQLTQEQDDLVNEAFELVDAYFKSNVKAEPPTDTAEFEQSTPELAETNADGLPF